MNDIHFVIGTMPSWPHSDDNMSYHAPRRADQPLPCTTNTASYAHSPQSLPRPQHQVCSCTPSARFHGNPTYAPTTPDTQFASPTIVLLLPLEFSTGLWDDRRLFSKMHSAYGLNFDFGSAIWVSATTAMRYTLHGPTHLYFPNPCFLLHHCGFMSLAGVTSPRTGYHRDGMARVAVVCFRSS